jgi:hypothetical protein
MIIITNKIPNEFGGRGYIWEDDTIPVNGYRFNWSLSYEMVPKPNIFSNEYIETFPNDFAKPSLKERVLIFLKLQKDEPGNRFQGL